MLEPIAGLLKIAEQMLVVGQKFGRVGMTRAGVVGVLDVKVVAAGFDLLDGYLPGVLVLLAFAPPFLLGGELLDADRLGLRVRASAYL